MDNLRPMLFIVTLSAVVILGIVIAVKVGKRRDVQRQATLAEVAAQLGLAFSPQDYGVLLQFGGFAF